MMAEIICNRPFLKGYRKVLLNRELSIYIYLFPHCLVFIILLLVVVVVVVVGGRYSLKHLGSPGEPLVE